MREALDWTALVTLLAGSGLVAAVLLAALVERLRRTFAAREELAALAGRLDRATEKLQRLGEAQAAHAAVLEELCRR